jgi:DNA modification methylase
MDADQFGDGGGKLNGITHQYNDSHPAWTLLMSQWAGLSFCITKPEAHAYVFCDIDRFHELKRFMQAAGWYVFRTPLIDFKTDSGRVPLPDRGPRRQWEMILYAIKGNKPVTHIYPDVIPCTADETMTHGAQKPVALYVNLLKRSVKSGDKVLDTFGGSGTLIPAAHALLCEATVIEQVPEYYGMCLTRLKALKEAKDPLSALLGV